MKISFKEIVLKRLCVEDIELLRQWRNSDLVSDYMFFQEEINLAMQTKWFESLHSENDFYFIIEYKQTPIGLINIKNIDWQKKQGEAGLFVALEKYRNTPLAIYASLALLTDCFEEKQLEWIFAKVKNNNLHTIAYNQSLGFRKLEGEKYVLTKERYYTFTKRLHQKLK
tara:strand:- start:2258 stop:2764 length:507 start_codon:yes stop_codon:yes gene_type:complete